MGAGRIKLYQNRSVLESRCYENKEERIKIIAEWEQLALRFKQKFYIGIIPRIEELKPIGERLKFVLDPKKVEMKGIFRKELKSKKEPQAGKGLYKTIIPDKKVPIVRPPSQYSNTTDYSSKYL